jgi:hypothetical protein
VHTAITDKAGVEQMIEHPEMDVFLIPVGSDRYVLYCEVPDDPPDEPTAEGGLFKGLMARFREMLAAAERERRTGSAADRPVPTEDHGWIARMRARAMCWIAEKIAEQRLLWNLRRTSRAVLTYPADIDEAAATEFIRADLRREAERHRWWLVVDSTFFAASGLLVLVPGPNVIAYYFAFRLVGHYLSMRGARHGLDEVVWTTRACGPLAELRQVVRLEPEQRSVRVHEVASRLHLQHLAAFFERIAIPSA